VPREAGVATAEQHDPVVLAARAGLAHDPQSAGADQEKLLAEFDRPIAMRRRCAGMQIPFDVFQQRREAR
jgi:hypothetical protein